MSVTQRIRIAGKLYVGTTGPDGVTVYDPPLPDSEQERLERNMQEVLESKAFPGLNTDTTFMANRGSLLDQFQGDELYMNRAIANARKKGYNPSPGDVYLSSLAREVGDPEAWVKQADGKGHIRKICEKRGIGCDGSVKVPTPEPRVDPDIARAKARERALARQAKRAASQGGGK